MRTVLILKKSTYKGNKQKKYRGARWTCDIKGRKEEDCWYLEKNKVKRSANLKPKKEINAASIGIALCGVCEENVDEIALTSIDIDEKDWLLGFLNYGFICKLGFGVNIVIVSNILAGFETSKLSEWKDSNIPVDYPEVYLCHHKYLCPFKSPASCDHFAYMLPFSGR